MKKLIRMACMALVAIAASVTVASCSKSDDNGGSDSKATAMVIAYGFDDLVLDNYDLKFNYTDPNGATASMDIKKADCEKTDTVVNNVTYSYYSWGKYFIYSKYLASGEASITATRKSDSALNDDESYSYVIFHGRTTADATNVGTKVGMVLKTGKVKGKNIDKVVPNVFQTLKDSYAVSSDGTFKFTN